MGLTVIVLYQQRIYILIFRLKVKETENEKAFDRRQSRLEFNKSIGMLFRATF